MDAVNLYETNTNLSQLVERAAGGEEIVIAEVGDAGACDPTTKRSLLCAATEAGPPPATVVPTEAAAPTGSNNPTGAGWTGTMWNVSP